jgi:hypothetical protein
MGSVPDNDLVGTWLSLLSLIGSAEDLITRQGGPWAILALAAADTASEALLGLITSGQTDDRSAWEDLYKVAAESGRLSESLKTRLRNAHRARNLALHCGTEPSNKTVQGAIVRISRVFAT